MADLADLAQINEEGFLQNAIHAATKTAQAVDHTGDCVWCGEEIPEGRRKANPKASLCVDCQAIRERGFKRV